MLTSQRLHTSRQLSERFAALRQIHSVRRSLSHEALLTLIRALVVSKLDYCNSVLVSMTITLQRAKMEESNI